MGSKNQELTPYRKFRSKWVECRKCRLCYSRNKIVLARGQVPCDVLFIGEAPGESEDTLGTPFEGPARRVLDHVMGETVDAHTATHGKMTWCLTNLVCCIPKTEDSDGKLGEPPPWAVERCKPRLVEFIRLCRPRLVVLVGKLSEKYVPPLPKDVRRVAIIHPAAILRMDPSQQGLAVQRSIVVLNDALEELVPF